LLVDYTNGVTFIDAFNDLLIRFPKIDVLNMSFSMAAPDPVIEAALQNFTNNGRVNPFNNVAAGVILVASAGNSNTNATGFPAAYKEVLSVINSNPNDLRHNHVDGWGTSGGSTYGYSYDIAAPGTFMFVNAVTGKGTSGVSTDHNITGGTSISAPLVSGISALLLEKNRYISQADFYNKIRNSADKVNSNVYNYNANASYPGKAEEMGYGRINCIKALNLIPLASEEVKFVNKEFKVSTLVQNNITVEYFGNVEQSVNYKVIDMYGKELVSSTMQISSSASIDVSTFSAGMYMLYFYNSTNQISGIFKVAKTN